jgi:hypothetical protein
MYPAPNLPSASDIAEMACQQRSHYPGFQLSGATIDIARAYNQYPQSVETTKLQATQIYIPDGTGGKIVLVILWLVKYEYLVSQELDMFSAFSAVPFMNYTIIDNHRNVPRYMLTTAF